MLKMPIGEQIMPSLEQRRRELIRLWHQDLAKLVAFYRGIANLDVYSPLPRGVTIASMIDALLNNEAKRARAVSR